MIRLINGDCLKEMDKLIKEGVQVDAIITDPPYGTVKGINKNILKNVDWDSRLDTNELKKRLNLIVKERGRVILFSQEPYTSELITSKKNNLIFTQRAVWVKSTFGNPLTAKKALLNYYEDIVLFKKEHDTENKNPLRLYFNKVFDFIGLTKADINRKMGNSKAVNCFSTKTAQFCLCTKSTYNTLTNLFKLRKMNGFKEFEDLEKENTKTESVFNLEGKKHKGNVFRYDKERPSLHSTQKPVALMEYLIKTYTNEGEVVLDFTMGSGTTGVACKNTKRKFIGIELDENYFKISKKRINGPN